MPNVEGIAIGYAVFKANARVSRNRGTDPLTLVTFLNPGNVRQLADSTAGEYREGLAKSRRELRQAGEDGGSKRGKKRREQGIKP